MFDLFLGGRVVVAAHVADVQPAGRGVVEGAVGVAQAVRPDRVPVPARSVEERVVGRHRSVRVDPVDLAARVAEVLGLGGVEVLAGGEVELAVVAEDDGAAVVFRVRVQGVLVQDQLAAGDGAVERRVRGESADSRSRLGVPAV